MNFLKTIRRVPVKVYHPETLDYRDRVLAAGGVISTSTLDVIEKFVQDCANALIWDKLLEVAPFAGSNLSAALVKLIRPSGVSGTLTNVNFVAGDYAETGINGGLLGDGATKYLNTGFNLQTYLPDNAHLSFYLREDVGGTTNAIGVGALNGTDQYWIGALTPSIQTNTRLGKLAIANGPTGLSKGFYLGSRTASNLLRLYKNGAHLATDTTAVTHTKLNVNAYAFAYNQSNTPGGFLPARASFYSIGAGLSDAEAWALHDAVRTLQRNLDRAIN